MRMISGAILLLGAEQAFSHSLSIGFPNAQVAQEVLYPVSLLLLFFGLILLTWGLIAGEFRCIKSQEKSKAENK